MGWNRWVGIISLFLILTACGETMSTAERDAIAPKVLDLSIDDCSISPSRAYVLIERLDPQAPDHYQVYSLATKQPVVYPGSNTQAYGVTIDWLTNTTHDILVVEPHWLIDFTTMVVTDTRQIDPDNRSPWWHTGPRITDQRMAPNGRYKIEQGTVWFVPTPGASPLTPTIVSVDNPVARLCGNAWESDSSGLYFIDYGYQARSTSPGPLRFLPIAP